MRNLHYMAAAANTIDTSSPYALLTAVISIIIAIGVPVGNYLRTRGNDEKTRAEIITLIQTQAKTSLEASDAENARLDDRIDELEKIVTSLQETTEKQARSIGILTRGFLARERSIERSGVKVPTTPDEQKAIDEARTLTDYGRTP